MGLQVPSKPFAVKRDKALVFIPSLLPHVSEFQAKDTWTQISDPRMGVTQPTGSRLFLGSGRVGDREEQKETFNSIFSSFSLQALKNGNFSTSFCMATLCIKQKTLRAPLPCVFGVALKSDFSP